MLAIQFLKLWVYFLVLFKVREMLLMICLFYRSKLSVIMACGSHNFEFVKSYRSDAVFDYNDPECGAKIRDLITRALCIY